MNNLVFIAAILAMMALAYQFGTARSRVVASGPDGSSSLKMHSLPGHYGLWVALWCGIPSLIVLAVWVWYEPTILRAAALAQVPPGVMAEVNPNVVLRRVMAIASGYGVPDGPQPYELAAAEHYSRIQFIGRLALAAVIAALAVGAALYTRSRIRPDLRARNKIEAAIRFILIACSGVAILTTVGIVVSMLGETLRFFQYVHPVDFFFGTVWNPRYSTVGTGNLSGFGLLPLLWGTVMIAAIAMLVAVPLGLMAAIYMAEYASPRLRSVAKPIIEILAGIPTIVYGFFALMIVGPFFASAGASVGLDIRATSAFTAGVVLGIMIIPFVSSLSDDIISQVPRAMRDGSLGLGATRSETVKRVVLPAALPGIVGAFLLALSRAIGETMIVVLAAGNSPILHADPFKAVSTVTVTIVNQLTGDIDFASPQSLVAFALGLTLFTMTLALNVVAIHIVRKYREQYE